MFVDLLILGCRQIGKPEAPENVKWGPPSAPNGSAPSAPNGSAPSAVIAFEAYESMIFSSKMKPWKIFTTGTQKVVGGFIVIHSLRLTANATPLKMVGWKTIHQAEAPQKNQKKTGVFVKANKSSTGEEEGDGF